MDESVLDRRVENRVAYLTMNRPERLNALSGNMLSELLTSLAESAKDPEVRAVMLTGTGRAFCAGGDVKSMAEGLSEPKNMEERIDGLRRIQEVSWMLYNMSKPTIAAVNGFAMGAGLGVALSCDLCIASDAAKFGTAYAKVGLGGDFGITWHLTQRVGPAKAKELLFLADVIDAAEAERVGIANCVVPKDTFMQEAEALAVRIASGPSVSYRYMKENVNLAVTSDFRASLDREALTHTRCGGTEDFIEGATAFAEKRQPSFKGR